jgi:hypothetical protein
MTSTRVRKTMTSHITQVIPEVMICAILEGAGGVICGIIGGAKITRGYNRERQARLYGDVCHSARRHTPKQSPPDAAGRPCRAGTLLIELPSCLQTRTYLYPLRGIPFHPPDRASELNLALDPSAVISMR